MKLGTIYGKQSIGLALAVYVYTQTSKEFGWIITNVQVSKQEKRGDVRKEEQASVLQLSFHKINVKFGTKFTLELRS